MASPRYQFRLDDLRAMAKNGYHEVDRSNGAEIVAEFLADRAQALAAECLRLRRREILRMGGFDR